MPFLRFVPWLLLAASGLAQQSASLPPETVAAFVTPGAAGASTETVMLKLAESPAASALAVVAVTIPALSLTVQPVPEPDTNAVPVGSVSSTVIVPLEVAVRNNSDRPARAALPAEGATLLVELGPWGVRL